MNKPLNFLLLISCVLAHAPVRAASDAADETARPRVTEASTANAIAAGGALIEADRMEFRMDRRLDAIGNAAIITDNQQISGDRIQYEELNETLRVIGNARIEGGGSVIKGPELRLNMGDTVGEMKQPTFYYKPAAPAAVSALPQTATSNAIRSNSRPLRNRLTKSAYDDSNKGYQPQLRTDTTAASRGDADAMFFEGQNKKRLTNARYTTCEAGVDDWYIRASEMEIDDFNKTGTARNARVEFLGVPILYAPKIDFSFQNLRKTGLLAPLIGTTTRSGFEVLTPFYWNIAPGMDATFGTRLLSKRGLQYQGEFRYMGETYQGGNNIEYLPSDTSTGENRYYAKLQHQQDFLNGWSAGYSLEKVSDDNYFSELSTRITTTSRVNLAQQASLNYADDVWDFNLLVQRYQTLGQRTFPYERLPQLTLNGTKDWEVGDRYVNTNLYTQWVSFNRSESQPNFLATPNGNLVTGVTGRRFTAYPSVSIPFTRPYGYITPKFGVHHTSYQLDNTDFTLNGVNGEYQSGTRTLPIFSLDSGLYYERNTRIVKNSYTQTLEPRLYYVYIPNRDQSAIPIFDTALADLNTSSLFQENQFTGNDRINNANQLTMAVTTRMLDARTGDQRFAATLGQRFNFTEQRVGLPGANLRRGDSSDIVAAVTAKLLSKWNVDAAWQYNTYDAELVRSNIGMRYNPEPGKVMNLSYRYTADLLDQINVSGQWPLSPRWYGLGRYNYSLEEHSPIEGLAGLEYDAGCWQARTVLQRVSTATADANYAFFFQLELGGLASIGASPMRYLERGIPGYTRSGEIQSSVTP